MSAAPSRDIGEQFAFETPPVTRAQLVMYAGASDDYNSIHYDEAFAQKAGLGGVIAHGMLTMGFMARTLTDWAGPRARVRRIGARFTSPVRPGDVVRVEGEVKATAVDGPDRTVECTLSARVGDRTVAVCEATVFIPVNEGTPS